MEAECKGCPYAGLALHIDLAVMHLDILADQMQPDAGSRTAVFRIEAVEEIREVFGADSGAVIFHGNRHPFVRNRQFHGYASFLRRKLESVG